MGSSKITSKKASVGRKLAKPVRAACKRVLAELKTMGQPSYEHPKAKTSWKLTYEGNPSWPREEAQAYTMFNKAGNRPAQSPPISPPRASQASSSASDVANNGCTAADLNLAAAIGNIYLGDDLAELVPMAGAKHTSRLLVSPLGIPSVHWQSTSSWVSTSAKCVGDHDQWEPEMRGRRRYRDGSGW